MCEFRSKIPAFCPFVGACSLQRPLNLRVASQTFREKRLQRRVTPLVFLVKKWNSEIGAKESHISLTMKKIVEWRQNNSRSKKKGTRSKLILICTFSGAILSSQWPFYSNSVISNCLQKLTWFLIPGLPYILSFSHYIKFYKRFYWFVFFVFRGV